MRSTEHFDRLASRYSRLRASPDHVDPLTEAVVELGDLRASRVLDVGCGPGTVLGQLTRAFDVVGVGLDASPKMSRDLEAAGFGSIQLVPFVLERRFGCAEALDKLRGRAYSTFTLMSDDEYEHGVAAAEAGLPAEVVYDLRLLNVVGVRP
jgi:SAM-dependent methyltransferase